MARISIPGIDMTIFDQFFPIPSNIRKMRTEEDFTINGSRSLKAPIFIAKGYEKNDIIKKEISCVIHTETQSADDELKDILLEIDIIRRLNHDNVLQFYEPISGKDFTEVAFVFEPIGCLLSNAIAEGVPALNEPPVIKSIMRSLFTALSYLHQNRIIHRDIQPENIVISPSGVIKIWNFRHAQKFNQKPRKLKVNEFRYQSLELLMQAVKYDKSIDIWSANCIFAELWLKKSLFPVNGREKVISGIFKLLGFPTEEIWEDFFGFYGVEYLHKLRTKYKYNLIDLHFKKYSEHMNSPEAMQLMHLCFRYNPKLRPSAEECLLHPYFSKEPKDCPPKSIISILDNVIISEQLRKLRNQSTPVKKM